MRVEGQCVRRSGGGDRRHEVDAARQQHGRAAQRGLDALRADGLRAGRATVAGERRPLREWARAVLRRPRGRRSAAGPRLRCAHRRRSHRSVRAALFSPTRRFILCGLVAMAAADHSPLLGAEGRATVVVAERHTAKAVQSGSLDVFATPELVRLVEEGRSPACAV